MSQQVVSQKHWLGELVMGAAGHHRVPRLPSAGKKRVRRVEQEGFQVLRTIAHVELDEGGDLIIAASASTKCSASLDTNPVNQYPLKSPMDIFVRLRRHQRSRFIIPPYFRQGSGNQLHIPSAQETFVP